MLVEEVPKTTSSSSSTIYFSSSINLSARPTASRQRYQSQDYDDSSNPSNNNRNSKNRPKVNYNVNQLMNAQTQVNDVHANSGPLKSAQQIQLERIVSKRLLDLNKETTVSTFELPKNFSYNSINSSSNKKKSRLGNTPTTKKIFSARRNLNSYFEEERDLIAINSILSLSYQFIDQIDVITDDQSPSKRRKLSEKIYKPRLRLCCICGLSSSYSRCNNCGLFSCSVRCNKVHEESRCI